MTPGLSTEDSPDGIREATDITAMMATSFPAQGWGMITEKPLVLATSLGVGWISEIIQYSSQKTEYHKV